jgi:hypothetical protein
MRNELIICQGAHASLWRSLTPMQTTWNMLGWLVRSVSPPLILIQYIDNMSSSTLQHIFFIMTWLTTALNHVDCAFALHPFAKSYLRRQRVGKAILPSTWNWAYAPISSNSQSQMQPHVPNLPLVLTIPWDVHIAQNRILQFEVTTFVIICFASIPPFTWVIIKLCGHPQNSKRMEWDRIGNTGISSLHHIEGHNAHTL